MILYHVYHESDHDSIKAYGVDPGYSKGAERIAWWCTKERIAWAVEHVAHKHDLCPRKMMVCSASFEVIEIRPTRLRGVYVCSSRKPIIHSWRAVS